MFNEHLTDYKNALLIGTGGGNDIVSTIIPALELQDKGINIDIAGILSPAAVHRFNGHLEHIVNRIEGYVSRSIPSPIPKKISFLDEKIPQFVSEQGINIKNFYDFSIRFGTSALINEVNDLIKKNNYDVIIGVDVGGDILARGKEDSTLLSPVMDFTTLNLLGNVNIPSYLVEFGLGTDGELRVEGMDNIISGLKNNRTIIFEDSITKDHNEIKIFKKIFDKVKDIRKGHTAVMTLQTLDEKEDLWTEYIFQTRIGKYMWAEAFEMLIPKKYFGKTYLMNAKNLYEQRTETAFSYDNTLEQYVRLKNMQPSWKTEMDMHYLWTQNDFKNHGNIGDSIFLLMPSKNIRPMNRENMILMGEKYFYGSDIDMALILTDDKNHLKNAKDNIIDVAPFSLLYKNKTANADYTAAKIKEYIDKN